MIRNKLIFTILFSFCVCQFYSYDCGNLEYQDLPITQGVLSGTLYEYSVQSNGHLNECSLTNKNDKHYTGSLWLNSYNYNWNNGFEASFNMGLYDMSCVSCPWYDPFCWFRTKQCGGSGFAFVIQAHSNQARGQSGAGQGYQGLSNVVAIEFDTWKDSSQNDPNERHISIIAKNGVASANQAFSLQTQDNVPNFRDSKGENYINNAQYIIRYTNKIFQVYINGALQIQSGIVDLNQQLGIANSLQPYYLGVVAANGEYSTTHKLTNWKLKRVKHTSSQITMNLSVNPKDQFKVQVTLYTGCSGTKYIPMVGIDSESQLSYQFNNGMGSDCQFRGSTNENNHIYTQAPTYSMYFQCYTVGQKQIQIYYQGQYLGLTTVTVVPGVLTSAKVVFKYQTSGNSDSVFEFGVIAYDQGLNILNTQDVINQLKNAISLQWPNLSDSQNNHVVSYDQNYQMYKVTVFVNQQGTYQIKSSLFSEVPSFQITIGAPSPYTSYAYAYNQADDQSLPSNLEAALARAKVKVYLADKHGSKIQMVNEMQQKIRLFMKYSVNNVAQKVEIQSSSFTSVSKDYQSIDLNKVGNIQFIATFNDQELRCDRCTFSVNLGQISFQKTQLLVPQDGKYVMVNQNSIQQKILNPFTFALQSFDEFDNMSPSSLSTSYSAYFEGPDVSKVNLCIEQSSFGVMVQMCSQNVQNYKEYIGSTGYSITLVLGSQTKKFNLQLVSDGSDHGAGNGPFDASKTEIAWKLNQPSYKTGTTIEFTIKLNTAQNLRFNQLLDETKFQATFGDSSNEKISFQKTATKGIFTGTVTFQSVGQKTSQFTIDGKSIPVSLKTQIEPSEVQKIILENFNDCVVLQDCSFKAKFYDNFGQLSDPTNEQNKFTIDVANSIQSVQGSKLDLGVYQILFQSNNNGDLFVKNQLLDKQYSSQMKQTVGNIKVSANIQNTENELKSGSTIQFKVLTGESRQFLIDNSVNQLVQVNFKYEGQIKPLDISLQDDGSFVGSVTAPLAGDYVFYATFMNKPIICQKCAMRVTVGDVDESKTIFAKLVNGNQVLVPKDEQLILENALRIPVFFVSFFDSFLNQRSYYDNYSFAGSLKAGSTTFNFFGTQQNKQVRFDLDPSQYDAYKKFSPDSKFGELKLLGSHSSKQQFQLQYSQVMLIGFGVSSPYSTMNPTGDSVKFDTEIKARAGEFKTIQFQLLTADGRINPNKYSDPTSSIKIIDDSIISVSSSTPIDAILSQYKVQEGTLEGSYIISFQCTKSSEKNLKIAFKKLNSDDFVKSTKSVYFKVIPIAVSKLVLQDNNQLVQPCKAGSWKYVNLIPYDEFNNFMDQSTLGMVGLSVSPSLQSDIQISFDGQRFVVAVQCAKSGRMCINSSKPIQNSLNEGARTACFDAVPGIPSAKTSQCSIDKPSFTVGESVRLFITPYDEFNNRIIINTSDPYHQSTQFTSQYRHDWWSNPSNMDPMKIDSSNNVYYDDKRLYLWGTYHFYCYFQGQAILNQQNAGGKPATPSFVHSQLEIYDSFSNSYKTYQNSQFEIKKTNYPTFKLKLNDQYNNPISQWPGWTLAVYITNDEITYDRRIQLCNDGFYSFQLCQDDTLPLDQQGQGIDGSVYRWNNLITNKQYTVTLYQQASGEKITFQMLISGDAVDSMASNLPIEVKNTVINPTNQLTVVAGEQTQFIIDIRTTNQNKRRNEWFTNIMDNILLTFEGEVVDYLISYGDQKGKYVVTLVPTQSGLNKISIFIKKTPFTGYYPILDVKPAAISQVLYLKGSSDEILQEIPDFSVDVPFQAYFIVKDKYQNKIFMNEHTPLTYSLSSNNQLYNVQRKILTDGKILIETDAKIPATYDLKFETIATYQFQLLQGALSILKCSATMPANELTAGDQTTIVITPRDQYNNVLIFNDDMFASIKTQLNYYYQQEIDTSYILGLNEFSLSEDRKSFKAYQQFKKAGVVKFKASIDRNTIQMVQADQTVKPNDNLTLIESSLSFFDRETSKFNLMSRSQAISEDNLQQVPKYLLTITDNYGNEVRSVSEQNQARFAFILTGDSWTKENGIVYQKVEMIGSKLLFSVPSAQDQRYKDGLWRSIPYTLSITYLDQSISYPILLKGRGSQDMDADIIKPLDYKKSVVNTNKIQIKAGEKSSFQLECRTDVNTRKADARPKWTFAFIQKDGKNDGNYEAQAFITDLTGLFDIKVTATKATNYVGDTILEIFDGENKFAQQINILVLPNVLTQIQMVSDLSISESADIPYKFTIIPQDKFKNTVDASEPEINIDIIWPKIDDVADYTVTEDPSNNYLTYIIKSRTAGTYNVQSSLLDQSKNYQFVVFPGAASPLYSILSITPLLLEAGDTAFATIVPFDQYGNQIAAYRNDAAGSFQIELVQGETQTKVAVPTVDNTQNVLRASWVFKQTGYAQIRARVQNGHANCDNCNIKYLPAQIKIDLTQFSVQVDSNVFAIKPELDLDYGSQDMLLQCSFFDKNQNQIEKFNDDDTFFAQLSGNNMIPIDLVIIKTLNQITISIQEKDQEQLSYLVINQGYKITLTYKKNNVSSFSTDFKVNIVGDASRTEGAGNGYLDVSHTKVSSTFLQIIAGTYQSITITLQTTYDMRYNGPVQMNQITVSEISEMGASEHLKITVSQGQNIGDYVISVYGEKALFNNDIKLLKIKVQGQTISQTIKCDIVPNVPDFSKTIIVENFEENTLTDENVSVQFQIFDKFNNKYISPEFSRKIVANFTQGQGEILPTTVSNNGDFVIVVTPIYPPKEFSIMIYYLDDNNDYVLVIPNPLKTTIKTEFAYKNTEIHGEQIIGGPVDQQLQYRVLLKDTKGYCFEDTKEVSVQVMGPYNNDRVDDIERKIENELVTFDADVQESNDSSVLSGCNKFYSVTIPQGTLQKVGYYQTNVFIKGFNNGNPVISVRKTKMVAGATNPVKTILRIPSLYMRGNAPLILPVNYKMVFFAYTADDYSNIIGEYRETDSIQFDIPFLSKNLFSKSVENFQNGTFKISTTLFKTGSLRFEKGINNGLQISANNIQLNFNELDIFDFPQMITLIPGECTAKNVFNNIDQLFKNKNIHIGEQQNIEITCLDNWKNPTMRGGNKFVVQLTGSNLPIVGSDSIEVEVIDNQNGIYNVIFTISWPGIYDLSILLDNKFYASSTIKATSSLCEADAPFYCPNTQTCVADSYLNCKLPQYSCESLDKPLKCTVNGVKDQCVTNKYECDCDEGFSKCLADNKCVQSNLAADLCSTVLENSCLDNEFPILCPDGSCRKNIASCPSQPGCPPGFNLCADQTCSLTCNNTVFEKCPQDRMYKCEDQTCAESPQACRSRITCSKSNMIICPDQTCAFSELQCRQPFKCNKGMHLCPDQSCAPSKNDCPSMISCPINYSRCEDNSCQTDCSNVLLNTPVQIVNQRRRMLGSESNNTMSGQCGNQIVCPGGECASSIFMCSTIESCPLNTVRCPDRSCAETKEQCVVKTCQPGQYHCWDGKCVNSKQKCSTQTSCPENQPVKCPQGNCVASLNQCKSAISCPVNSPYKCANGECRSSESDCPTFITCPANRPIKCQDQSCQKTKNYCNKITEKLECDKNEIICPDGSCSKSLILCPTTKSCDFNQIRCWDNTCAYSIESCPSINQDDETNPTNAPIRCADGSTRALIRDCPTQIICPEQYPIRCEDGTCKESNSQCYQKSECSFGLSRCPDGSCSLSKCGTPITCSSSAPYYCHDNTCKKNPADCPAMPKCSDTAPILCPDGTCVSQRVNCKGFEICPMEKPVRCPDMNCYASQSECQDIQGCPPGRQLCSDGSCSADIKLCPKQNCPSHLPHQCLDGFCVSDVKYCDLKNGCQYNKPFKCADGSCQLSQDSCEKDVKCDNGQFLCPDGSCNFDKDSCPNQVGCFREAPHKCASGQCVNLNTTSCEIANCPSYSPIKCLNGLCVDSISSCPSFINIQENQECLGNQDGNIVPCSDGRCVASSDQCRPVYSCGKNQVRCQDGSCRPLLSLCPKMKSRCPPNKPYQCDIGACASKSSECPTTNGCPFNTPVKCEKAGSCAETNEKCQETYANTILPNNCKFTAPFKCDDGTCVQSKSDCVKQNGCPPATPIRCIDGTCVSDYSICLKISLICTDNLVQCPDKSCKSSWHECKLLNGCSVSTPFKCADGSCASTPLGKDGCSPTVKCPDYKPFLCSDGECVGDLGHCRVQHACPASNPIRCPNLQCVSDFSKCQQIRQCPITSPILCDSGICVKKILECKQIKQMFCPANAPIKCVSGECKAFPALCKSSLQGTEQSRRLLADSKADEGCSDSLPHRCYDGSCRASIDDCQILPACSDPAKPYRCRTGLCERDQYHCLFDKDLVECGIDQKRCEDGICRKTCPQFNGCPLEQPFNCANGVCAKSLGECAGASLCPIETPFRCSDNSCVVKMENCKIPLRLTQAEKFYSTISHLSSTYIDFIQSEDSQIKYAQLLIPAGALLNPLNGSRRMLIDDQNAIVNDNSQVLISPISSNIIEDTFVLINIERFNYIRQFFPSCVRDLKYAETVRSPVFKITSVDRDSSQQYRFPMQINLKADMAVNSDKNIDYCLGKLDEISRKWTCSSRLLMTKDNYAANEFSYPFTTDGIYAIIFNPDVLPEQEKVVPCLFFCQYKWTIFYSVIGSLFALFIIAYVMWRISRYMVKYRQAKKQMDNYIEQINELQKSSTQIVGMSMKDKMQGIVFQMNPLHEEIESASEIAKEDQNGERYEELELMVERMSIREKMLTQVNSELQNRNKLLSLEYEELTKKMGNRKEIQLLSEDEDEQ